MVEQEHTMGDIASKVLSNDNMPSWTVFPVELLFDISSNVLLDVILFEGDGCDVDRLLLQLLTHVDIFNDSFSRGADKVVLSCVVYMRDRYVCCFRHCEGRWGSVQHDGL